MHVYQNEMYVIQISCVNLQDNLRWAKMIYLAKMSPLALWPLQGIYVIRRASAVRVVKLEYRFVVEVTKMGTIACLGLGARLILIGIISIRAGFFRCAAAKSATSSKWSPTCGCMLSSINSRDTKPTTLDVSPWLVAASASSPADCG
jgi:hypothetical protein